MITEIHLTEIIPHKMSSNKGNSNILKQALLENNYQEAFHTYQNEEVVLYDNLLKLQLPYISCNILNSFRTQNYIYSQTQILLN